MKNRNNNKEEEDMLRQPQIKDKSKRITSGSMKNTGIQLRPVVLEAVPNKDSLKTV